LALEHASDAKNAYEGVKVFEADLSEDLRKFDVLPWFCTERVTTSFREDSAKKLPG